MNHESFTVVAAVNNRGVLQNNLCLSPDMRHGTKPQLIVKEGFSSASLAYNSAIEEAQSDIIVFAHQDVYLPNHWFKRVSEAIRELDNAGVRWGVLGCIGSSKEVHGGLGRVFTNGLGLHGNAITKPEPVETLDEILLILRKSSGLRFDPTLPHFHMYGVDICLSAFQAGLTSFSIPAFCVHNTNQLLELPPEFYACYRFIKRKWSAYLPIAASCMNLTRLDGELRRKQLSEMLVRIRPRQRSPMRRVGNPRSLLPEELWRQFELDPTVATPRLPVAQAWQSNFMDNKNPGTNRLLFSANQGGLEHCENVDEHWRRRAPDAPEAQNH